MTRDEIDAALGQTPCLCGDCTTWHFKCYAGKSDAEINAGYRVAYRAARAFLKNRAAIDAARNRTEGAE